ncbi:hypothetical protein ACSBR2_028997 [Camellia fascicularis]
MSHGVVAPPWFPTVSSGVQWRDEGVSVAVRGAACTPPLLILSISDLLHQVLNFDRFSWTTGSSKPYLSPTNLPLKIPAGKGHSLLARRVREMWETIAVPVAQKFEQKPTAIARKVLAIE